MTKLYMHIHSINRFIMATAHITYESDIAYKIILIYCTSGQCERDNDSRQDTNKKIIQNDLTKSNIGLIESKKKISFQFYVY